MRDQSPFPNDITWDELDRYLAGESSAEESVRVADILKQVPEAELIMKRQGHFQAGETDKFAAGVFLGRTSVEESWRSFLSVVADEEAVLNIEKNQDSLASGSPLMSKTPVSREGKSFLRGPYIAVSALAALVVILLAGVTIFLNGTDSNPYNGIQSASVYTTPAGRQARLTLPDGTSVLLDVGSRLEVPGSFGEGARDVTLTGQAEFEVVHHAGTPFIVNTRYEKATVLGTRFAVRSYEDERSVVLAVSEGRVGLGAVILQAGEQVVLHSDDSGVRYSDVQSIDPAMTSFARGVLIIDDRKLGDVLPDLERWYGVQFEIADSTIIQKRINGHFEWGPVSDLIEVLEWTLDLKVSRTGQTIMLDIQEKE